MNLFLPYETNIRLSVNSLDDSRLIKQILECKTILDFGMHVSEGYGKHPVVQWYAKYPGFVAKYAIACCEEFEFRFRYEHRLKEYFVSNYRELLSKHMTDDYIPYYVEGAKTDPNHIRTTENVSELFQKKLNYKWNHGKRPPKWTRCEPPEFYKK